MIAFALTYLLTLPTLGLLILLGIIFEFYDNVLSVYTGVVAALIAFFMFDVSITTLAVCGVIYFVVGIIWSFWRFKRYTDAKVDAYNTRKNNSDIDRSYFIDSISLKNCYGKIISWILVWPFSMIENVTADIVQLLKVLVTNVLKYFYTIIIDSATSKLKPNNKKD